MLSVLLTFIFILICRKFRSIIFNWFATFIYSIAAIFFRLQTNFTMMMSCAASTLRFDYYPYTRRIIYSCSVYGCVETIPPYIYSVYAITTKSVRRIIPYNIPIGQNMIQLRQLTFQSDSDTRCDGVLSTFFRRIIIIFTLFNIESLAWKSVHSFIIYLFWCRVRIGMNHSEWPNYTKIKEIKVCRAELL